VKDAKKSIVAALALAAAVVLVACGGSDDSTETDAEGTAVTGKFVTLAEAPASDFQVNGEAELERTEGGTVLSISVSGLEPKARYIAHLHTGGCDQADPGGPHFQFEKGGSEKPPNELHLKFAANGAGEGRATISSKREVPPGEAGSVVIHRDDSHEMSAYETGEGEAEAVFVHEGVDHSKEGGGHGGGKAEPEHAHSDKLACAELEGAAPAEGGSSAGGEVPTIVVRNGEPVGGVAELEFDAGEEVRFRVSSDEAEEIHVHGYDLAKDVPAGGTVEFAFPAELEGIYEAELEQQGVQIVELQINP
jgi:hypothetical protein